MHMLSIPQDNNSHVSRTITERRTRMGSIHKQGVVYLCSTCGQCAHWFCPCSVSTSLDLFTWTCLPLFKNHTRIYLHAHTPYAISDMPVHVGLKKFSMCWIISLDKRDLAATVYIYIYIILYIFIYIIQIEKHTFMYELILYMCMCVCVCVCVCAKIHSPTYTHVHIYIPAHKTNKYNSTHAHACSETSWLLTGAYGG
jgi:hypothetical protein